MENYVTGVMIKQLREKKHLTQEQLASMLNVSEKTISKWETGRGLPDISIIPMLANALNISIVELFNGELHQNQNVSGNMQRMHFYICPICHNVIASIGDGSFSCCGVNLISEEATLINNTIVTSADNEFLVDIPSKMTKNDFILFAAYVTSGDYTLVRFYPEGSATCHFEKRGHGYLFYYDLRNGLYKTRI